MQCSVATFSPGLACGACDRLADSKNEVIPLSSCNRDILAHLRGLHLSLDSDLSTESRLIRARCGLWKDGCESLTVCPSHRYCLGIGWRTTTRTCAYPGSAKGPNSRYSVHMTCSVLPDRIDDM